MSSSITIPKRHKTDRAYDLTTVTASSSSSSPSTSTSTSSSAGSPGCFTATVMTPHGSGGRGHGAEAATSSASSSASSTPSSSSSGWCHARRPSLLSSSLSHSEHTVINLNSDDEDVPPRLITCVKSSQGFDWNQEIFLPSYCDYDPGELERKPDPVQEIILTDEEAAGIFPFP